METPACDLNACKEPSLEDREITRDRGLPNLDFMADGMVSTMDDCFADMEKITYGARVIAKLVDDKSCDAPEYESICQELLAQNRTIFEQDCRTPG